MYKKEKIIDMKYLIIFILLFNSTSSLGSDIEFSASSTNYKACFTPGMACTDEIIAFIAQAKKAIRIQAFSFTSWDIADALIAAHKRGVDVVVLLDRSYVDSKIASYLTIANIPIYIDYQPTIAHNKVMIIDDNRLITGSFNFTIAAQRRNAENILLIQDKALVKSYLKNWQSRRDVSMAIKDYERATK